MKYRTFKTTMGRKVRVRMSSEEIFADWIYRFSIVLIPFVTSILFFYIWVKAV